MSDAAELSPGRTLWEALGDIPDRRGAKGRRSPLRSVLTLSLAAMLAGGNDLCSIFRWGRRLPPEALYLLGLKRAPCHAMYHYFYKALTSTRPSTWPRPNRCWAPGRKGPVGRLGARVQTARNRGDRRQAPARECPGRARRQRGWARGGGLCQPAWGGDRPSAGSARGGRDYGWPGAAQEPAAGGSYHHRRRRVLPAGGLPGRARPQGGLPVHREGEPTAPHGRHRPRIRRRISPRSSARLWASRPPVMPSGTAPRLTLSRLAPSRKGPGASRRPASPRAARLCPI